MLKETKMFEKAWSRYIEALKVLDERQENGQRTQMAKYGVRVARTKLHAVCESLNVEVPTCARYM